MLTGTCPDNTSTDAKERRTIIDKLLREVAMQLSTMQDIAVPCRGRIRAADRCATLRSRRTPPPSSRPVTLHLTETAMTELSQFLIVFNHQRGALHHDVAVFVDSAEALRAYDAAERHFAEQEHIEVVLIGSDSLDTVRRTHANYFDGTAALERLLPAD